MTGRRTRTALLVVVAATAVGGSLAVASPATAGPAAAARASATAGPTTKAEATWTGTTSIRLSKDVTRAFLRQGVALIGQNPAGGTQLATGNLAVELPVSTVTETSQGVTVLHKGALHFTDGDGTAQHSIVLTDITVDLEAENITATVYAGNFAPSDGYWKNLGTRAVFTLKTQPSGPSSFPYSLVVTAALAKPAAKELGWFPQAGTRLGAGFTDLIPPQ